MKQRFRVLVFAILLVTPSFSFGQNGSLDGRVVLLTSSDAPGALTKQRVIACLKQLAHEWKIEERSLPKVVVVHVSNQTAAAMSINDKIAVRKNRVLGGETDYFEVWIAGAPDLRATVRAFENVLESHLQLQVTDEQRNTVMARIVRIQDATIGVQEGK